ncbi:MAG TPA: homoserine kinase [Clostridiales bacterium UBA8960]|jgi:homoserine kinase|nr:homoserine kinase [Clostridiales bacterium UBA8960]
MIKIKVPATTANIGPGFDTLGLALNLYQEITVDKAADEHKIVEWPTEKWVEDDDNFVILALEKALLKKKMTHLGYHINMLRSDIPISRGLGSSAAAIVAGLFAANYLMNDCMSKNEILEIATELEGHPDNVAPAIFGNLVLATTLNGETHFSSIDFPDDLKLNVFIPDFKLSTSMARDALPNHYSRPECIFNISRVSFLIHALLTKNYEHLPLALSDKIHEPYRFPLIEDSAIIREQIGNSDAYGMFISGAGPTLIALVHQEDQTFDQIINLTDGALTHDWKLQTLDVNKTGAIIEILE